MSTTNNVEKALKMLDDNGTYYAGIAAGVDKSLPASEKLKLKDPTASKAANVSTAISHMDPEMMRHEFWGPVIAGAACFLVENGMLSERDVEYTPTDGQNAVQPVVSPDAVEYAMSIILVTKVNFWSTNHHTGQGEIQGYAKKYYESNLSEKEANRKLATQIMHRIGHWTDTAKVWHFLGFANAKIPEGWALRTKMVATNDVLLRTRSFPAGTGKVALCCAMISKCATHDLFPAIYDKKSLEYVFSLRDKIKAGGVIYHEGAQVFAGVQKVQIDEAPFATLFAGLATMVKCLWPRSSLARAPGFKKELSDMDGYDDRWRKDIESYKTAALEAISSRMAQIAESSDIVLASVDKDEIARVIARATGTEEKKTSPESEGLGESM